MIPIPRTVALTLLGLGAWLSSAAGQGLAPGANPVYPESTDSLRFDHAAHQAVACGACHPGVGLRERPVGLELAGHASCVACHPEADDRRTEQAGCATCHRTPPGRAQRQPAALVFSHAAHPAIGGGCGACHASKTARPVARFARCAGCHQADLDARRCGRCHPSRADGRLELALPGGQLAPVGGHGGDDHRAGWEAQHARVAGARAERCRACHAEADCDRCHRGAVRSVRQHPGDWELTHASLARADAQACTACHRNQSDCLACHRASGLADAGAQPAGGRHVHPIGFGAGGLHGAEARRNLSSCSGCHAQGDCLACHASAGLGRGVSPHPAGFATRCRLMRSRNPRPCAKCHLPAELERLCP